MRFRFEETRSVKEFPFGLEKENVSGGVSR